MPAAPPPYVCVAHSDLLRVPTSTDVPLHEGDEGRIGLAARKPDGFRCLELDHSLLRVVLHVPARLLVVVARVLDRAAARPLRAHRPLRACRAFRPLDALRSLRARGAGGACRPRLARWPLRSCRARVAFRTLRASSPRSTSRAGGPLWSCSARITLGALDVTYKVFRHDHSPIS